MADQLPRGGAIPTSALHSYQGRPVPITSIRSFINSHHYSHTTNGVKRTYGFGLYSERGELVGAALLGRPATRGVAESYCPSNPRSVIEIRRFVLIDETPRNAESYFLGYILRWLRTNTTLRFALAYSDLSVGHTGTIYRASNFVLVGQVSPIRKLQWRGRLYHDRSLRVRYGGVLKPFAVRLRSALESGEAQWVDGEPKNIWMYTL